MIKLKELIAEEKGDLLALVGKDEDDDLTTSDMQTIGRKVADMEGDELQSYLGMIKALGGYYGGRGEGEETLDDLRKAGMEAYNKAKETNESYGNITKEQIQSIVKEELKNAGSVIRKLMNENSIFKHSNRLLPNEWEKFKKNFISKNRDHKVVSGKIQTGEKFEAIVKKSNPREAVVKYLMDDWSAKHDMKPARFYDYIR